MKITRVCMYSISPLLTIMASRKSCTHFTWAEAKAKNGGGSASSNKKKIPPKKQSHNEILAAKIINKSADVDADRKIQKAYRRQEEKAAALAAKRDEERELKRLASLQEVKPYDMAKDKLLDLVERQQEAPLPSVNAAITNNLEEMTNIAECKAMQCDEIVALEAMMPENFYIVSSSNFGDLQELVEQYRDAGNCEESLLLKLRDHPPISFLITSEVDCTDPAMNNGGVEMELVALMLIQVTLPVDYPTQSPPRWDFVYTMVTDKLAFCSVDKPLESLTWFDEASLREALNNYAMENLLGFPCVYELGCTWLPEHVFEFLNLHPHAILSSKQQASDVNDNA